jgi:thiaminase
MTAFDLTKLDDDSSVMDDLLIKGRVIHTLHNLRTEFNFNDNLNDFSKTMLKEGHSYYNFIEYGGNDDHPSMSIHLEWVKTYLPEFYDDKMLDLLKEWEHYIRPSVTATEKNFNSILNKNTTKFT